MRPPVGALTAARSYRWATISGTHVDARTWSGDKVNRAAGYPSDYTIDKYTNYATLNWTLWSGNRVESQISQAKLTVDSNQWGVAAARQLLKFNATDAYYKLMGTRDNVKLAEESVADWSSTCGTCGCSLKWA